MNDDYLNVGEWLIDLANSISSSRIIKAETTGDPHDDNTSMAVIKLALVLKGKPALSFRAIVEDWSLQRIVRELY